ncbi:hypothetical protein Hanom_Chr01g00020011 [Helianthus anomalus]
MREIGTIEATRFVNSSRRSAGYVYLSCSNLGLVWVLVSYLLIWRVQPLEANLRREEAEAYWEVECFEC